MNIVKRLKQDHEAIKADYGYSDNDYPLLKQAAEEIERLRRVEMIAREISIDVKNVIYNHHDELASKFLCDLAIAELAKRLAKLKAALDNG